MVQSEHKGWLRVLLDYAERQLPAAAAHDPELRRRARAGLAFAAVFLTQVPIFAATFAWAEVYTASWIVLLTGVALSFTPVVMRRDALSANAYVISVMWTTLYTLSFTLGGWRSPSLFWMAALPVMAMLSLSTRAAVGWLIVVAVSVSTQVGLRELGVRLSGVPSESSDAIVQGLAVSMLSCVVFGLGFSGEALRSAATRVVERVNRDMRLVLDNVDQGLVTIAPDGKLGATRSSVCERWFGAPHEDESFADWIGRSDPRCGDWLRMGLSQVFEALLPPEVTLGQLPTRLHLAEHQYSLRYQPILAEGDALRAVLVVITDVTEQLRAERAQVAQHELMMVFSHLMRDREGVLQFYAEASEIVARWSDPDANALRLVHTLKGNAGLFGLDTVMQACHEVESKATADERAPTRDELAQLRDVWEETSQRIQPLLADETDPINISDSDLLAVERLVESGASVAQIIESLRSLRHDRAAQIFGRLAGQAVALAKRLRTCELDTKIEDHGMRFDPARWASVWSVMAHVVRNAVDHGGESPERRMALGKPPAMTLRFESSLRDGRIHVCVGDDGAGIDWARVRERARAAGLPHGSAYDLHEALFADGVTTKSEATTVSGRGVGMGALREACHAIGASVQVRSELGVGTNVEIDLPVATGDVEVGRAAAARGC